MRSKQSTASDSDDANSNPKPRSAVDRSDCSATFGDLLRAIEGSEYTWARNLEEYEQIKLECPASAMHFRVTAGTQVFRADPSEWPGVDELESICDHKWGSGLTGENLRRLRGDIYLNHGLDPTEIEAMTIKEVVRILRKQILSSVTNQHDPAGTEGANASAKRPSRRRGGKRNNQVRQVLVAAILNYHKYSSDAPIETKPIVGAALAAEVGVSKSTVSEFFKNATKGKGYESYVTICNRPDSLSAWLSWLAGETPSSFSLQIDPSDHRDDCER